VNDNPNSGEPGYELASPATLNLVHGGTWMKTHDDYLERLPPEFYRGQAYVHWSMTMHDRQCGWLKPIFYYKFRELLTHVLFRYGLCCPIFCCMPDHIHLLWLGILDGSDQRVAMKHFRKHVNDVLQVFDVRLQDQPYDHVLKEEERKEDAFEAIADYIARNPERAGLVKPDAYATYAYTSCLIPGYPELKPFQGDYWSRFWRAYSFMAKNGLMRLKETKA
jgi:putative transposase